MRILVLAPQWPDPPRQGAAIRNLHILKHLAARHDVTLLTFVPEDGMERSRLAGLCEHAEALPMPRRSGAQRLKTLATSPLPDMAWRLHSDLMSQRVRELTERTHFDAIHVEGIEMAPYGLLAHRIQNTEYRIQNSDLKLAGNASSNVPTFQRSNVQTGITYDAHNAEYQLQRRAFTTDLRHVERWPQAFYSLVQWWRLRRFERSLCEASDHVIAVSAADRGALARLAPLSAARMRVLPNGVDTEHWSLQALFPGGGGPRADEVLVFDGTMDFRPNIDAAVWFAEEVWPRVRQERRHARFFIVGRNPAPQVLALGGVPGITVTGAVDDPRPWVAGAAVYVVPMRMGGGVRLKVLQAMSMERAIVSTLMGMEGVDARNGRDVLLARSPQTFAREVLSLLSDPDRRATLGRAARELMARRYAWEVILPGLEEIYPDIRSSK